MIRRFEFGLWNAAGFVGSVGILLLWSVLCIGVLGDPVPPPEPVPAPEEQRQPLPEGYVYDISRGSP